MSFIPGEGTTVPDIDSAIGSGIAITTSPGGADFISTFLTAGGGISIVPSLVDKSVQISGVPGPSGVTVVQSGFGSGIEAVDVAGVVTLTGQYVAGSGLQMVPSGINKTVTIVNTGSVSSLYSQNGSGISITTDISGTRLAANLTGGTGISVNPSGTNKSQTLVNTGVTSLVGGSGIGVSAATGGITVTNTGVRSLAGQTGAVALTSTGNTVTISSPTPGTINLESTQGGGGTLTAITAGTGIAVSGSAPAPTVSNTGILSLTSGTGIVVGGGQQPSITNSGVTSLVAGAGITLSGATGAVTVSAIPPTPPATAPINIGTITCFGGFSFPTPINYTIPATGCYAISIESDMYTTGMSDVWTNGTSFVNVTFTINGSPATRFLYNFRMTGSDINPLEFRYNLIKADASQVIGGTIAVSSDNPSLLTNFWNVYIQRVS